MLDLSLSFALTWIVILAPPFAIRRLVKRQLDKGQAATIAGILMFANVTLFIWLGSTNSSHGVLVIGAFVAFFILSSKKSKPISEQRKELGYD